MAVELAISEAGTPGDAPSLIILHGLFGSKKNWGAIMKQLGRTHHVAAADLRNHGDSPWADEMSYEAMAEDVAALIETKLSGKSAIVLGHSMGGKVAMMLALTRPELVAKLCVVDIAPAPTMSGGLTGYVEIMRNLDLSAMERRSDVDKALQSDVPEDPVRMFLLTNIDNRDDGLAWKPNLDALAASMPAIEDFPDTDGIDPYEGPTLFIAGGRSDYIGPHHQPEIDRLFPQADVEVIPEAGHWVHADETQEFMSLVTSFLDS